MQARGLNPEPELIEKGDHRIEGGISAMRNLLRLKDPPTAVITSNDLTAIGATRGPAHLRQSLLDPEAEVPETFAVYRRVILMPDNFLQVRVVTSEGTSITGVRLNEDAFTIQLRDYSDRVHSLRKDELRELHKDWGKSPMPSYRDTLTESELQDLIAYLSSLQGAP